MTTVIGGQPQLQQQQQRVVPLQQQQQTTVVEIDMNAQPPASYFDPSCAPTSTNADRRRQQPPRVSLRRPLTATGNSAFASQPNSQPTTAHGMPPSSAAGLHHHHPSSSAPQPSLPAQSFAAPPRPISLAQFQQSLRELPEIAIRDQPNPALDERIRGLMFILSPDASQQVEPLRASAGSSTRHFIEMVLAIKPGGNLRSSFEMPLKEFKARVDEIITRARPATTNATTGPLTSASSSSLVSSPTTATMTIASLFANQQQPATQPSSLSIQPQQHHPHSPVTISRTATPMTQQSASINSMTPESEIVWLMDCLGPETREIVEDIFFSRSSLEDFRRQLAATERRTKRPISFDHYHLGTIFDMLIEKDGNFNAVSPFDYVQRDIVGKMRVALAEWILEVCVKFKFCSETFFLALALVDRFLMVQPMNRQELQLAGVSATLLASKYEEIYPPDIREFVAIAANSFSKEDVIRMERLIFTRLQFGVTVATSNAIAQVLLAEQDPTPGDEQLVIVHYILTTAAVNTYFGQYRQALIAAAAVHMSRVWCDIPSGSPSQEVAALIPNLSTMLNLNQMAARNSQQTGGIHGSTQSSLAKVFSTSAFMRVSSLPIPTSFIN